MVKNNPKTWQDLPDSIRTDIVKNISEHAQDQLLPYLGEDMSPESFGYCMADVMQMVAIFQALKMKM